MFFPRKEGPRNSSLHQTEPRADVRGRIAAVMQHRSRTGLRPHSLQSAGRPPAPSEVEALQLDRDGQP
eukprot:8121128-Pyramimonas_sp.AAC.1